MNIIALHTYFTQPVDSTLATGRTSTQNIWCLQFEDNSNNEKQCFYNVVEWNLHFAVTIDPHHLVATQRLIALLLVPLMGSGKDGWKQTHIKTCA